jgi:Trypsin-like peptidase domain
MNWGEAIKGTSPHIVRIETPTGYGTGFLSFYNYDKSWCGIATAAHVVRHAEEWQEPIKIRNENSMRFLKGADDRVIFVDYTTDSAVVLFLKGDLQLPEVPVALMPVDQPCSIGADIGWLGYPVIEPNTLCFFAGTVSARQTTTKAYLIDGVAINGVSGGPVFHCPTPGEAQVIGSVSAYHANRATGEALPGLLRAQDVSHFHGVADHIRSIDEANAKKREFEEAQKQKLQPEGEAVIVAPGVASPAVVSENAEPEGRVPQTLAEAVGEGAINFQTDDQT